VLGELSQDDYRSRWPRLLTRTLLRGPNRRPPGTGRDVRRSPEAGSEGRSADARKSREAAARISPLLPTTVSPWAPGYVAAVRLIQVTLAVSDVAQSVEFYRRLGLEQIVADERYARFRARTVTARYRSSRSTRSRERRRPSDRRPRHPGRSARQRPHRPPLAPRPPSRPVPTLARRQPARARATSCGRSPKENDAIGARSSTATSSRSSCSKSSTRFTQNGRSVIRPIDRICSRRFPTSVHDAPSEPSPPARDTSPASRAVAAPATGACTIGTSKPRALTRRAYNACTRPVAEDKRDS